MAESLYDVRYVARFVVGNPDAEKLPDEAAIGRQTRDLNEALAHGGRIVAQEKKLLSAQHRRTPDRLAVRRLSRWIQAQTVPSS